MASAIPAAKQALETALAASPDLVGVKVIRTGDWSERIPEPDRVIVETSRNVDRQWAGLGNRRLEETFTLRVTVECFQAGDDLHAVEARMWEVVTAVEQTVLTDITLAGAVRQCLPVGSENGEQVGPSSLGGVGATIELHFDCQQRVQLT